MKNIFIIGFMGSGKSRLAEAYAERTNRALLECDQAIEQREKMTIPEIFLKKGEPYFRQKETDLLKELKKGAGLIVSTGGGMAMKRGNTDIMRQTGKIVFLDTPFDICYGRIQNDPNRPVANQKTSEQLIELFKVRRMVCLLEADDVLDGTEDLEKKIQALQALGE